MIARLQGVGGPQVRRHTPEQERELRERIRKRRDELAAKGFWITDEEITAWKRQGRP